MPTVTIDVDPGTTVPACTWCGEVLTPPYLRRPGGTALHVACVKRSAATVPT